METDERNSFGIRKNLNVSIYANPEFTFYQMEEIRLGLENNIDVSIFSKVEFNSDQMEEIRLGLESKY